MKMLLSICGTSSMTFSTSLFFQCKADIYQGSALVLHAHLIIPLIGSEIATDITTAVIYIYRINSLFCCY